MDELEARGGIDPEELKRVKGRMAAIEEQVRQSDMEGKFLELEHKIAEAKIKQKIMVNLRKQVWIFSDIRNSTSVRSVHGTLKKFRLDKAHIYGKTF